MAPAAGAASWAGEEETPEEELPAAAPAPAPAAACAGSCSGNGICDVGVCVCYEGFTGAACEHAAAATATPAASAAPSPVPSPSAPLAPPPAADGGPASEVDVACPPMTAPGFEGVECYARLHPELLPLGVGGGSGLCFILLLACAACRQRRRDDGDWESYRSTGRDSRSDYGTYEDERLGSGRKKRRRP